MNRYQRYYANNKEKRDKEAKERRESIRQSLADYKNSLSCERCGFSNPVALDFHHARGEKSENIGKMVSRGYSFASIMAEIEKCDVLCANCHRIEHGADTSWLGTLS
jgi:predicted HNH restriction endonuclease